MIAKGRGRKPRLAEGTVAEVVRVTRHEVPDDGATHWTTRAPGRRLGLSGELVEAIETWAAHWNEDPKPFVWHKPADEIIDKVGRGRETLHQIKTSTYH